MSCCRTPDPAPERACAHGPGASEPAHVDQRGLHGALPLPLPLRAQSLGFKPIPTEIVAGAKQAEDKMNADDETPRPRI